MKILSDIMDPYSLNVHCLLNRLMRFTCIDYLERYSKTKILQIDTTGDEFFLTDNEIRQIQKYLLFN